MKKLVVLISMFLSLDLYGGIDRLFSPAPSDVGERKDLTKVLALKLGQNPTLAASLKEDFRVAFTRYNASFSPSVAVVTDAGGSKSQAIECPYAVYKNFVNSLIFQLSQLGYGLNDIYRVEDDAVHDNRQNLLNCWLEVNLLSEYGNKFFEQKSEHDEFLYVRDLYRVLLPGFCLILSNRIRDGF